MFQQPWLEVVHSEQFGSTVAMGQDTGDYHPPDREPNGKLNNVDEE